MPEPGPDEVVVRVEASPINPSDLGLLVGAAEFPRSEPKTDSEFVEPASSKFHVQ
jgi:NADPH:quinone reductase-like Zn-dependent oxidoreductase